MLEETKIRKLIEEIKKSSQVYKELERETRGRKPKSKR